MISRKPTPREILPALASLARRLWALALICGSAFLMAMAASVFLRGIGFPEEGIGGIAFMIFASICLGIMAIRNGLNSISVSHGALHMACASRADAPKSTPHSGGGVG